MTAIAADPAVFPAVNALGEQLLRVLGPPEFAAWTGEYGPIARQPTCPLCDQSIAWTAGPDEPYVVSFLDGAFRWAHRACYVLVTHQNVTDMATAKTVANLPTCSNCGLAYGEHDRPVATFWDAICELDESHTYRPSEPYRSDNWPHHLVIDSPRYSDTWRCAKQGQRVGETLACTCGLEAAA